MIKKFKLQCIIFIAMIGFSQILNYVNIKMLIYKIILIINHSL